MLNILFCFFVLCLIMRKISVCSVAWQFSTHFLSFFSNIRLCPELETRSRACKPHLGAEYATLTFVFLVQSYTLISIPTDHTDRKILLKFSKYVEIIEYNRVYLFYFDRFINLRYYAGTRNKLLKKRKKMTQSCPFNLRVTNFKIVCMYCNCLTSPTLPV